MLSKMLSIAATAHQGQVDKAGRPYFLHCMEVMRLLDSNDDDLNCIAVGHDLLEDTDITTGYLLDQGFNHRIVGAIFDLTKHKSMSYEYYKDMVKSNPDAVLVKIADLTHNMDLTRLGEIHESDLNRLDKYNKLKNELIAIIFAKGDMD